MTALSTTDADRTAALEAAEAAGRVDEAFLARFDVLGGAWARWDHLVPIGTTIVGG